MYIIETCYYCIIYMKEQHSTFTELYMCRVTHKYKFVQKNMLTLIFLVFPFLQV